MKISYAVTCCNELEELQRLLPFLIQHKREQDEIVVQQDETNVSLNDLKAVEVESYLTGLLREGKIDFFHGHKLNQDFASFKNELSQVCTGDFIFQIDADEMPHEYLIQALPFVLENSDVDLIYVPRINTVEGITEKHIKKWNWNVDENGWINFPDRQSRIYRKSDKIYWKGKVHETIQGISTYSSLPKIEEWCLYHHKSIDKQEKQNNFYAQI